MDCGLTGSLSMEFPRQEYWSRLPFPSPGNLPNPGTEPMSPSPTLQVVSCIAIGFFTAEPPAKPMQMFSSNIFTQVKRSTCPLHFMSGFSVTTYLVLLPGCGDKVISGDTLSPASCVILLYELVKRLGGLLLETFLVLGCSHCVIFSSNPVEMYSHLNFPLTRFPKCPFSYNIRGNMTEEIRMERDRSFN